VGCEKLQWVKRKEKAISKLFKQHVPRSMRETDSDDCQISVVTPRIASDNGAAVNGLGWPEARQL